VLSSDPEVQGGALRPKESLLSNHRGRLPDLQPANAAHHAQLTRIMFAAQKMRIPVVLARAGTVEEIEREFAMMAKSGAPITSLQHLGSCLPQLAVGPPEVRGPRRLGWVVNTVS
jgi:hypothetical protein